MLSAFEVLSHSMKKIKYILRILDVTVHFDT